MKKLLLASVAMVIPIAAQAADLGVNPRYKAPVAVEDSSYWNGFYIGGNIGFGRTDFNADCTGCTIPSSSGTGVLGGVQLGYNHQFGYFVLGLETDFQVTGITASNALGTQGLDASLPWFGTTRLRGGFLVTPAFLVYGTGGAAYGRADLSGNGFTVTIPGVGWTAGAGVEYAFGPKGLSVGAEYLHVALDGPGATFGGGSFASHAETDLARLKFNWRF